MPDIFHQNEIAPAPENNHPVQLINNALVLADILAFIANMPLGDPIQILEAMAEPGPEIINNP
jgi:hypothetical protein